MLGAQMVMSGGGRRLGGGRGAGDGSGGTAGGRLQGSIHNAQSKILKYSTEEHANSPSLRKVSSLKMPKPKAATFRILPSPEEEEIEQELSEMAKYTNTREAKGKLVAVVAELLAGAKHNASFQHKFVVLPRSHFRTRWDSWCFFLIIYVAIFTPVQISFLAQTMTYNKLSEWTGAFVIDCIIDFTFLIDIGINFRTAEETRSGTITFNHYECAKKYMRSFFIIDVLSIFPFDLILHVAMQSETRQGSTKSARMTKLLRLFRISKILKVLRVNRIVNRWQETMQTKYAVMRILLVFVAIILCVHWLGCSWYFLVVLQDEGTDTWVKSKEEAHCEDPGNPPPGDADASCLSVSDLYTMSIYWATMTLTTIGYGDISPANTTEYGFSVLAMLITATIFSLGVGTMAAWSSQLLSNSIEFHDRLDKLTGFFDKNNMPHHLRVRVRKYCFFRREADQVSNEEYLLGHLSQSLRDEIRNTLYSHSMTKIPCFRAAPKPFMAIMCDLVTHQVFGPQDIILEVNQFIHHCYLLEDGRVQSEYYYMDKYMVIESVVTKDARTAFFGERSLMTRDAPSSNTYRCLTFVKLIMIEAEPLRAALVAFPPLNRHVKKFIARQLWRFVLRAGKLNSDHMKKSKCENEKEHLRLAFEGSGQRQPYEETPLDETEEEGDKSANEYSAANTMAETMAAALKEATQEAAALGVIDLDSSNLMASTTASNGEPVHTNTLLKVMQCHNKRTSEFMLKILEEVKDIKEHLGLKISSPKSPTSPSSVRTHLLRASYLERKNSSSAKGGGASTLMGREAMRLSQEHDRRTSFRNIRTVSQRKASGTSDSGL